MPVEWSRHSGETIEEIVAVLLCRRFPAAQAVRPSVGDGGIDVLVPSGDGGVEVYQVKKFASNLTSSQKGQVTGSFKRFDEHRRSTSLDVRAWHLTMPLNPTKENLSWFGKVTKDASYPCDWRGLNFIDGLVAEFPDVIDHYLHDGADRMAKVVGQMTTVLGLKQKTDGAGLVTPVQIADQLHAMQPILDTDPHFRYAISLDLDMPDPLRHDPGLICAVSSGSTAPDGAVVTVRVYPRFAAALQFRPIPINVVINAERDSPLAASLESFRKYGTPLQAPPGSVRFDADLPGGLGGAYEGGSASIGPAVFSNGSGEYQLRLAALAPGGSPIADVLVDMQPVSVGSDRTGARAHGTDRDHVFDVEILTDLEHERVTFRLTIRDPAGRHPAELLRSIGFLSELRPPIGLAIAQPFGPITGEPLQLGQDWLNFEAVEHMRVAFEALTAIQAHTTAQLTVPSANTIDDEVVSSWVAARRLIDGETLTSSSPPVMVCLHPGVAAPDGQFSFASTAGFVVAVGDESVELGQRLFHCAAAEVVPGSIHEHLDHNDCTIRAVDGTPLTVRMVRPRSESA